MRTLHRILATTTAAAAALVVMPATADAAPAWRFHIGQAPTGTTTPGQLALDRATGSFYISDNAMPVSLEYRSVNTKPPRVSVFSVAANRPVRSIDMAGQPAGPYHYGPLVLPIGQIPDGLALDTVNRRVVTTSAHAGGISVFSMDARRTGPKNLVTVFPNSHPMGVVTDNAGRAWASLFNESRVVVIDTASRRVVRSINTFHPTLLAHDPARGRIYVGNNDNLEKRRNYISVIDTRSGRVIHRIPATRNSRAQVDPATGRIIIASFVSGRIAVVDPDSYRVRGVVKTGSTPSSIAVDAQRRLVYVTTMFRKQLLVLDADSMRTVAKVAVPGHVHTLALDPGTGRLYGTQNGTSRMMVVRPEAR
ncbi:MAG: YncE family protein [Gordonia sp. (in: high G+C Gram-positive bacteria)]|uniref:YncE family protein n=1 Tax=Gordonia sp. (in: high G+C Gram-positive bacteria) TaxID=84139 RepID=UPI0039E39C1C